MVERVPSPQLNSFQGLYPVNHPGQGYPAGFLQGSSQQPQAPHSTLAQLHMQVERLAQQQPPPPPPPPPPLAPPPHWPWCQSVPLPRPPPIRLPQRAPEPQGFHPLPPPQGRGFMPPPHHRQFCPTSTLKSPGSPTQVSPIHCVCHFAMQSELFSLADNRESGVNLKYKGSRRPVRYHRKLLQISPIRP